MPGRTSLKKGLTQTSKEEGGSTTRTTAQIEKYYSGGKRPFSYKKNDRGKIVKIPQMLTGGQAAIAAKAPPPNVFNEKDLAVLREEKAKGRGMGLQDEKVQPGKVMKARMGVATDYKKYLKGLKKTTSEVRKEKMENLKKGYFKTLGVFPTVKKKMGGGMMKKYSKGGGFDAGTPGKVRDAVTKYAGKMKSKDRLTSRDIELAKEAISKSGYKKASQGFLRTDPMPKKMGGGMMQKPMGYSKGVSVKARGCKLGKTRPTKIT